MTANKTISVIGLGYIGLPTAALLASRGYKVYGIDVSEAVVNTINQGEIHIVEPDLAHYVSSAVESGNLKAFTQIHEADIYMICVPTPFHKNSELPTPNTNFIKDAIKSILPCIKNGDMIILESTSPVGTSDMINEQLCKEGLDHLEVSIAYCPERVLPGNIMKELVYNARVIGGINDSSTKAAANFYKTFVIGDILQTDARTAEMCKLTENSFRDVNIAFANELSIICDKNRVDVWELIRLANQHPRVEILQPGTGVGGHCIAVDPWFIASQDPENSNIIKTAREVNDSKPRWVVDKIMNIAELSDTKKIACLGLAFKPNIDDLRESPSVEVVNSLIKKGFEVSCVEPNISQHNHFNLIDLDKALDQFDVIAILVKHREFVDKDILRILTNKNALDFCGIL